jgi:hypothetical protein
VSGHRQRVQRDQALVAFDEGDVGEVEAAHLEDARADLEQAVRGGSAAPAATGWG